MAKAVELVEIKPIERVTTNIRIVGDTPLIMHAWSAKAKRQMLEKEIGAAKSKTREAKNPIEDFATSMYWLTPGPEDFTAESMADALKTAKFGFPVTAFKQAAITAAYRQGWSKDKASLRGAFFILPEVEGYYSGDLRIDFERKAVSICPNTFKPEPMLEIKSDIPVMREDMVRVGMGVADIRYRGEFQNWSCDMTISYNKNGSFSLSDIINFINAGGYVCGVGEWRPEKDGQYGMFHVEAY